MRLEQGQPTGKGHAKPEAASADGNLPMDYPSTRYFQIHFQYLYELIEALKEQLLEANRQIAAQNEILRVVLQKPDEFPCAACQRLEDEKPPKPAYGVHETRPG